MDDELTDNKKDFLKPESGTGKSAVNFDANVQREQFLSGGSQEINSKSQTGEVKTVEVNGKNWEYKEYGNPEGIPLLNVHGWIGSSAEGNERLSRALAGEVQDSIGLRSLDENAPGGGRKVRELTEGLKDKYRIIAPQLPGFGRSEAIDEPTLDNMADQMVDFSQAVGMDKPVFFGSSMGGIIGVKMAARHPDALRALVLQGTMAEPKDMSTMIYVGGKIATWKPIAGLLEKQPNIGRFILKNVAQGQKDFKMATPENQEQMSRDVNNVDPKTALSTLKGIGSHLEKEIGNIEAPVIVLDGAAGEMVPIAKSKELAGRFHKQDEDNRENLRKNIVDRKTMYFQVGGVAGEHGHSVINSAPEQVAVMINHAVSNYLKV